MRKQLCVLYVVKEYLQVQIRMCSHIDILAVISCGNNNTCLSLNGLCLFASKPQCEIYCLFRMLCECGYGERKTIDDVCILAVKGRSGNDTIFPFQCLIVRRNHIVTGKIHCYLSALEHTVRICVRHLFK